MGYGFVPYLDSEAKKLPKKEQKAIIFTYCDFDSCKHKDCAAEWADRRKPCPVCGKEVKPGEKFFNCSKEEGGGRKHYICALVDGE